MSAGGLRERKKLETYRAIIRATRRLVRAHGLDAVTVEMISTSAGVAPRTFFNYFSCKEEALVALDPLTLTQLGDELRARPATEGPVEALRAVLIDRRDPEATLQRWHLRSELVAQYPELRPRHLAAMAQVEATLTRALADRIGIDPDDDPRVRLLVATVLTATRTANTWWHESPHSRSLLSVLDAAFELIAPVRLDRVQSKQTVARTEGDH